MIENMELAKRYLWAFVELGFLALLSLILIYLLLGQGSANTWRRSPATLPNSPMRQAPA